MSYDLTTEAQAILAPLTKAAIFLTLTIDEDADIRQIRDALSSIPDLVKDVDVRDLEGTVSCITGIGAAKWQEVTQMSPPSQLRPFQEIKGEKHTAVSTAGDLFFHIRANRRDLCFELETRILDSLSGLATVVDETVGFRYFDARDLLGFVDGTANPIGKAQINSAIVGNEDPEHIGGSYLVVQKYLHQIRDWKQLKVEHQEDIIGRTKTDNVELPDASGNSQKSHKTLNTIVDAEGKEHDILRDNMPFGSPAASEFGTYFIGYSSQLDVTEEMLKRMYIGDPPGKYDQILDFSTPVTGCTFFVPSVSVLENL